MARKTPAAKRGVGGLSLGAFALLAAFCAAGSPTSLAASANSGASDAKPAADLGVEAERIVASVLGGQTISQFCDRHGQNIREPVRDTVARMVFKGEIENPREAGTEAGEFLDRRCADLAGEEI